MPTDDLPDGTYFRVTDNAYAIEDGYSVDEVVVEGGEQTVYESVAYLDTFHLAEILMAALVGPRPRDGYELGVWYPAADTGPAPRPDQPPLPGVAWAGDGDYEE